MYNGFDLMSNAGRAILNTVMNNDTIYVSAKCDSLVRRVDIVEASMSSGEKVFVETVKTVKSDTFSLKWFSVGLAVGIVATVIAAVLIIVNRKS